jgi:putative membrane protein
MTALVFANHLNDHGGYWFPLVPLLFLGFWIVVLVTVGRRWGSPQRQSGEAVLAERYARGEIDEGEYRERQAVLRRRKGS